MGAGTVPCMCRTQVRVTGGPGCVPLTRDWSRPPLTLRFPPGAVTEPAPPVRLKKPCAKRPPGSSIITMHQRAGPPFAPPSIPKARSPKAPGPRRSARRHMRVAPVREGVHFPAAVVPAPSGTEFQEPSACFFQMLTSTPMGLITPPPRGVRTAAKACSRDPRSLQRSRPSQRLRGQGQASPCHKAS